MIDEGKNSVYYLTNEVQVVARQNCTRIHVHLEYLNVRTFEVNEVFEPTVSQS